MVLLPRRPEKVVGPTVLRLLWPHGQGRGLVLLGQEVLPPEPEVDPDAPEPLEREPEDGPPQLEQVKYTVEPSRKE